MLKMILFQEHIERKIAISPNLHDTLVMARWFEKRHDHGQTFMKYCEVGQGIGAAEINGFGSTFQVEFCPDMDADSVKFLLRWYVEQWRFCCSTKPEMVVSQFAEHLKSTFRRYSVGSDRHLGLGNLARRERAKRIAQYTLSYINSFVEKRSSNRAFVYRLDPDILRDGYEDWMSREPNKLGLSFMDVVNKVELLDDFFRSCKDCKVTWLRTDFGPAIPLLEFVAELFLDDEGALRSGRDESSGHLQDVTYLIVLAVKHISALMESESRAEYPSRLLTHPRSGIDMHRANMTCVPRDP